MANYTCAIRSNYFEVTDEDAYEKLFAKLDAAEDELSDFTRTLPDGRIQHAFGAYSFLVYHPNADDEDADNEFDCDAGCIEFLQDLQPLLAPGQAAVVYEVGHEKLRYLVGNTTIAIAGDDTVHYYSISRAAEKLCKQMLGEEFLLDDTY